MPSVPPGPRGLDFDALAIGDRFRSAEHTLSETEIERFAELSRDKNPLHTDPEFARRSIYRGTIAHGMLVQSLATGLAHELGIFDATTLGVLEMSLVFCSAVKAGDSIALELEVLEKDPAPAPRRGWVKFGARVVAQGGQRLCIDGRWSVLMLRGRTRPGAPSEPHLPDAAEPGPPG